MAEPGRVWYWTRKAARVSGGHGGLIDLVLYPESGKVETVLRVYTSEPSKAPHVISFSCSMDESRRLGGWEIL